MGCLLCRQLLRLFGAAGVGGHLLVHLFVACLFADWDTILSIYCIDACMYGLSVVQTAIMINVWDSWCIDTGLSVCCGFSVQGDKRDEQLGIKEFNYNL